MKTLSKSGAGIFIGAAVLWSLVLFSGCGGVPPLPAVVEPQDYQPVTVQQLQEGKGIKAGDKVKVPAYFWQFLEYDPDVVRNYMTLVRHPLAWYPLEWCALYGAPDMKGYFDRVVMETKQREDYKLKRLEHIMVYGEMAQMGAGLLYLRVHRIERLKED